MLFYTHSTSRCTMCHCDKHELSASKLGLGQSSS